MKAFISNVVNRGAAVLALGAALPLMAVIAILILFNMGAPVLFQQKRPGFKGRVFSVYKFRTMRSTKAVAFKLTQTRDDRVTPLGRWLRATHLDELPQLFNIVKGEMNFVGPRPVPLELYEEFKGKIDGYDKRHWVKPGVTGFSQIHLGYVNTFDGETVKWMYDMYYISRKSMYFDFLILLQTFNFRRATITPES